MNWFGWMKAFGGGSWPVSGKDGFEFKNPHQGSGSTNHPRNHKRKKAVKAKAKNRAGKKARKAGRKK